MSITIRSAVLYTPTGAAGTTLPDVPAAVQLGVPAQTVVFDRNVSDTPRAVVCGGGVEQIAAAGSVTLTDRPAAARPTGPGQTLVVDRMLADRPGSASAGGTPANITTGAATGITAVTVGADGWWADITISGLAAGGTYNFGLGTNFDPATGTPKVTFTVVSLGFDTTGTPTTVTRTIYGTKQVRKPYPNATVNEESAAGGNVTVRVALSDYIYTKDNTGAGNSGTAVTATFLSGFYTQGSASPAASGVAVTNSSGVAYPKVVGNWSWPGYDKLTSSFPLRAVAFHASANSGRPVQCVKFTAADTSAHIATTTVTDPTVDAAVGDDTPVVEYVATLDGSTFTQGNIVTCNFVAYPRVGDTAACLDTTAGTVQPTPLYGPIKAVCDRTGAYATSAVVVDPVSGNDATGAVTTTFDPATPPAAYLTMAGAFDALRVFNNTTYSRNNAGGSVMYLRAGTHPWVNGTPTLGTTPDTWLTITRYPTDTRASVIIGTKATGASLGLKVRLLEVTIAGQSASGNISGGAGSHLWVDRCEINAPTANQPPFYINTVWYVTRTLVTSLDMGLQPYSTVNAAPGIIRGNVVTAIVQPMLAYTFLGNTVRTARRVTDFYSGMTVPNSVNTVVAFSRFFEALGSNAAVLLRGATADTHGLAFIQNLIENTANTAIPALQIAADGTTSTPVNNVLIWNNTVVGQRCNLAYNEVDTAGGGGLAVRAGWSVKNNIFDDANIKSDTFAGSGYLADGAKVGNWSLLYGAGCSGNVWAETANIGAPGSFLWEIPGLKAYQPAATGQPPTGTANTLGYLGFLDRRSFDGTTAGAGNGDYHLTASSPALGMQRELLLPYSLTGAPRSVGSSPGAYSIDVVLADIPTASRVFGSGQSVTVGVTVGVSLSDQPTHTGCAGPNEIIVKDVILAERPSAVRAAGGSQLVSHDLELADRPTPVVCGTSTQVLVMDIIRQDRPAPAAANSRRGGEYLDIKRGWPPIVTGPFLQPLFTVTAGPT